MSKDGGYKIIDLQDFDITTTSQKIKGIYREISQSYRKTILLAGLKINGVLFSDEFVHVVKVGDEFLISVYSVVADNTLTKYDIFIEEDDKVTLQVKDVEGGTEPPAPKKYYVHTVQIVGPGPTVPFRDKVNLIILSSDSAQINTFDKAFQNKDNIIGYTVIVAGFGGGPVFTFEFLGNEIVVVSMAFDPDATPRTIRISKSEVTSVTDTVKEV